MEKPVFKLWLSKPTLAVFQMPEDRVAATIQQHDNALKDLGVRNLIQGRIWSDERWSSFGVEWFPNWQAVRDFNRCLDELHWFQYINSETYLGLAHDQVPVSLEPINLDAPGDWIVHVWVSQSLPAWYDDLQASYNLYTQMQEPIKALGVRDVLSVYSRPGTEEFDWWGISLYPSMEAMEKKVLLQEEGKWWKFTFARSFLGTAEGGELLGK